MPVIGKIEAFCLLFILLPFAVVASSGPARHHRHQHHHHQQHQNRDHLQNGLDVEDDEESSARIRRMSSTGNQEPDADSTENSTSSENCTMCSMREAKRSYRLEAIKTDILRKLRLSSPPNVTGRRLPDIPQIRKIIDGYQEYRNDSPYEEVATRPPLDPSEYEDSYATTLKYVLFARSAPREVAGTTSNVFYFQFQPEMASQQIVNATINIYIRRVTNPGLQMTWLLLYRYGRIPTSSDSSQEREIIGRRKVNLSTLIDTGQWFSFDIRTYVETWISQQNLSYGIVALISDARGEPLAVIEPRTQEEQDRKPFLMMHVRDQTTSRLKRTTDTDCDERSSEKHCCRYPLTVDFEQFRWDWVIVPKRYSAYYCSGECTFQYYQRYTHTGLVQQASNKGGPCCSPRKVSAISMLYYDEYMNIVYGRLPDMVVDQCGCS